MLPIIFWIIFGALIGWIAAILQDEVAGRQVVTYVIAGAVGGLAGGLGGQLISHDAAYSSRADGLTFAVFGAIVFVILATFLTNSRGDTQSR